MAGNPKLKCQTYVVNCEGSAGGGAQVEWAGSCLGVSEIPSTKSDYATCFPGRDPRRIRHKTPANTSGH